ncbi:MAG: ypdA 1 [Chitinophagaceae bacterium]|nr:ypdA 1 [Chitinophagaceae bacterium]
MKQKYAVLLFHLSYWIFNIFRNILLYDHTVYTLIIDQMAIAGVCYINYFILLPYALKKNKWYYYLLWFLSFSGLFTFIYSLWTSTHFGLPFLPERTFNWYKVIGAFNMSFLYGGLSSGARLLYDWSNNQKKNKWLELQKKSNEIKSMKSNMNIPLLLDTLNYTEKISVSDPSKAEAPILLLSEVLRYGLYESAQIKTSLQQEMAALSTYVQLQNQVHPDSTLIIQHHEPSCNPYLPPGVVLNFITTWKSSVQKYISTTQAIDIHSTENAVHVYLNSTDIPAPVMEELLQQFKNFSDELFEVSYIKGDLFIHLKIINLNL